MTFALTWEKPNANGVKWHTKVVRIWSTSISLQLHFQTPTLSAMVQWYQYKEARWQHRRCGFHFLFQCSFIDMFGKRFHSRKILKTELCDKNSTFCYTLFFLLLFFLCFTEDEPYQFLTLRNVSANHRNLPETVQVEPHKASAFIL